MKSHKPTPLNMFTRVPGWTVGVLVGLYQRDVAKLIRCQGQKRQLVACDLPRNAGSVLLRSACGRFPPFWHEKLAKHFPRCPVSAVDAAPAAPADLTRGDSSLFFPDTLARCRDGGSACFTLSRFRWSGTGSDLTPGRLDEVMRKGQAGVWSPS